MIIYKLQRTVVHPPFGRRFAATDPLSRRAPLVSWRDAVCSRASSARYVHPSSGLVLLASSNVLRRQLIVGTGIVGVVVEGARTNLVTGALAIGGGGWTAACTVSANSNTSPSGDVDADGLTATGTTPDANARVYQAIGGSGRVASVYARRGTQGSVASLALGGGTDRLDFSPTLGAWSRHHYYQAGVATTLALYLNHGGSGGASVASDDHAFWGAQVEAARFASSLIEGTRATEYVSVPSKHVAAAIYEGASVQFLVQPFFASDEIDGASHVAMQAGNLTLNGLWSVRFVGDSGSTTVQVYAPNLAVTSDVLSFPRDSVLRVKLDPKTGTVDVRGATSGDGAVSGIPWRARHPSADASSSSSADLFVGYSPAAGPERFFGVISEPYAANDSWDLYDHAGL